MPPSATTYARRPAMGTFFEAFLVGDDAEHLEATAAAVLDEVERLGRLLSRFDPAAEVARVNREAGRRPVRVDADLWDVLGQCDDFRRRTDGFFDVTAGGGGAALRLDAERRTVSLSGPRAFLDLGGFAKGYALDRGAEMLRRFGVRTALLNGGTSSLLAVGRGPDGDGWPVDVRDPFVGDDAAAPVARLRLADQGFSCSAALRPGQVESDLIAPGGGPLTRQAACVVVAATAAEAEALSTACLVMEKERAAEYLGRVARPGVSVGWVDAADGRPRFAWLRGAP